MSGYEPYYCLCVPRCTKGAARRATGDAQGAGTVPCSAGAASLSSSASSAVARRRAGSPSTSSSLNTSGRKGRAEKTEITQGETDHLPVNSSGKRHN